MNQDFANYAWQNDLRIHQLTGAEFSPKYHEHILEKPSVFDSRLMTNALALAKRQAPERFFALLHAFGQARYVEGRDTADLKTVCNIASQEGISCQPDDLNNATALANQDIQQAQNLMQAMSLQGVPQLIQKTPSGYQPLPRELLFTAQA
ncbi:hypothetical protein L5B97_00490 [Avibacterium sp. 20-15]|uniref:hypothetical protein n=1 Tax=unclassified Avibacterium TaxID=2685287 RepID=UPI0020267560|nr:MULTISPECIES: hypothetical protein [unclassified Avibacterium]MCW9731979.1 hypothetical protein [Avibacterium sp. 20-15]URL04166.1 hypothetical protein L4F93_11570 [Avibacterium sp. 20-132]